MLIKRKRYFVLMYTKRFGFTFETNSFKLAKCLADLRCFEYSKIQDNHSKGEREVYYVAKTIYINDRRA